MTTPLDDLLKAARVDPEQRIAFYDAVLKTEIYLPSSSVSKSEGSRQKRDGEDLEPLVYEQEGQPVIPLFDALEKLQAWVQRPTSYVCMPAHALIEGLRPGVRLILNPGTESFKGFEDDEIRWLQDRLKKFAPERFTVEAGTEVIVGEPATIPDGLEDSLRSLLRRNREITEAYLAQMAIPSRADTAHLMLVFKTAPLESALMEALLRDLGMGLKDLLPAGKSIDLLPYGGTNVDRMIVERVKAFYVR